MIIVKGEVLSGRIDEEAFTMIKTLQLSRGRVSMLHSISFCAGGIVPCSCMTFPSTFHYRKNIQTYRKSETMA